jgi:hypothetical protein
MALGLVDTSNRTVRPVSELGKLVNFATLEDTNPILHPDGTVAQTVGYMKKIVRDHHEDVSKIAESLYDPKLSRFLRNIFKFVMTYVKYETDSAFTEQLRTPLRTLKDQRGDCDCMSILIGAILYNKNIPFNFRVSKYDANRDFSHVYVIVPRNGDSGYYVMDTVIKTFDKEKSFVDKEVYFMDSRLSGFCGLNGIPIQLLDGYANVPTVPHVPALYGLYGDIMGVTLGTDLAGFGLGSVEDDETAMYNHLVRTRDVILAAPHLFKVMKNPLEVARLLDYAIRYWNTPQIDHVLGVLEAEEQRLLRDGVIVYPLADLSGEELGELGLGIFKKIGNAVKKGAKAVAKTTAKVVKATVVAPTKAAIKVTKKVGKGVATAAKAVGKGVAKGAKAVAQTVARFNPVSLAARGGLLLAIRINLFKLADKLQYGLYTEAQAQAAGINLDDFRNMQESYSKTRNLFVNTLKGKEDKLKQAISKAVKNKAINGLGELGDLGAVSSSLVTAALGFITSILGFFKGKKNPATGEEFTDEDVTEGQIRDLLNQSELYDEDGYPINTTAQPEADQNFWKKAGKFASNVVSNASNLVSTYLPSGGGGGGSLIPYTKQTDDEYEYEPVNQQDMIISPASGNSSAVTANVMTGGMMSNIGSFIKKNALMLGIGAAGIAGAIYLMTRKKKSSRGLSGVVGAHPRGRPKPKRRTNPHRLKPIKLS